MKKKILKIGNDKLTKLICRNLFLEFASPIHTKNGTVKEQQLFVDYNALKMKKCRLSII